VRPELVVSHCHIYKHRYYHCHGHRDEYVHADEHADGDQYTHELQPHSVCHTDRLINAHVHGEHHFDSYSDRDTDSNTNGDRYANGHHYPNTNASTNANADHQLLLRRRLHWSGCHER